MPLVGDIDETYEGLEEPPPGVDKAAGKARGQAKNRAQKRGGKGMRHCPGCDKWLPETEFAMNQTNHTECKKILDNISGQARRQGREAQEWLNTIKADPKKCQVMIASYKKASDQAKLLGVKKIQWSVVTYKEEIESSSGVHFTGGGQMMWEKQAI